MVTQKVIEAWVRNGNIERLNEFGYDSEGNFITDRIDSIPKENNELEMHKPKEISLNEFETIKSFDFSNITKIKDIPILFINTLLTKSLDEINSDLENLTAIIKVLNYVERHNREPKEKDNVIDPKIHNEVMKKFRKKKLLNYILKELSKKHMGDDELKMTLYLVCISGLLKDHLLRQSMKIVADSCLGKDNANNTIVSHMPVDSFIKVTNATQSVIEDDISFKRIIVFSEVNANRELGANKNLVEVLKQKMEGGTSSIKKDLRNGMKTARHEEGEQGTVLWGTTEIDEDRERGTRMMTGNIKIDYPRITAVNNNTLDSVSDLDKLLDKNKHEDSWIRTGLTYFFKKEEQPLVIIPYAKHMIKNLNDQRIIDENDPRCQRDLKRLIALTSAMTYLFQEQRKSYHSDGEYILESEPQDFINTLIISKDFFNQSYTGIDERLNHILDVIKTYELDWISRDELQKKLDISRNTIKDYTKRLSNEGLIEMSKGCQLNDELSEKMGQFYIKTYDGNKIYIKRCQKGVKKPLIRCQIKELKEFLEEKTNKQFDTFDFNEVIDDKIDNNDNEKVSKEGCQNEENIELNDENIELNDKQEPILEEIDTFSLTPLKKIDWSKKGMNNYQKEKARELGVEL